MARLSILFFYDEEPEGCHNCQTIDKSRILVSPPFDYPGLRRWLSSGNWQAIYPANQEFEPIDTFRTQITEMIRRMKASGICLIIDSFHDDTEWNVLEI